MKFAFIARVRRTSIWPAAWLCEALDVSRSGFHAWLNRSPSRHARYDETLLGKVRDSFKMSDRTYGARRVWHDVLVAFHPPPETSVDRAGQILLHPTQLPRLNAPQQ